MRIRHHQAAGASNIQPEIALVLHKDLKKAREKLVLSSELHLLYLVTETNPPTPIDCG
jgi:hypothetical protein